ncbi:cysteine hydrolase family protein [Glutamicibacter sp. MCAF14]|uniref:cysteine hydrolase family protein n=1 Tax=Glutamicibacter sp. MCAF14 TaxID=3233043 RepID=UPI003F8E0483
MNQTSSTSDFSNPALLLIDLQVGFFKDPALARSRQQVAANCNRLAAAANAAGIPVISVRTVHKEDRSTWTLKMLEDGQGYLFEGTSSAAYLPELLLNGAIEVIKRRDSAFWNTGLGDLLLVRRANSLVIAGVSTDTCISATAADAFATNLPVAVARDATASGDPDFESSTLEFMRKQHRQKLLETNHIISQWESEKE